MKNACQRCRIYYPNNSRLESCPRCGDPVFDAPDNKKFKPYYYDPNTAQVRLLSASSVSGNVSGNSTPPRDNASSRIVSSPKSDKTSAARVGKSSAPSLPDRSYSSPQPVYAPLPKESQSAATSGSRNSYSGIINNYQQTEIGSQSFFERTSLFFRCMHRGNTRHIISFVDENDGKTYRVCFYGEFSAVGSAFPEVGEQVTVIASPNGNEFFTENVYIGAGGGRRIKMRNQRTQGSFSVFYAAIAVLALCAFVYMLIDGGVAVVRDAFITFAIVFVAAFIIGAIFLSRFMRFRTLAVISLVVAAAAALLIYKSGGITPTLISSVLTLAILIYIVRIIITGGRR